MIESHYENDNGGALRRLNAITAELDSLDFDKALGYALNGLRRGFDVKYMNPDIRVGRRWAVRCG